jgi:hypothetical protein
MLMWGRFLYVDDLSTLHRRVAAATAGSYSTGWAKRPSGSAVSSSTSTRASARRAPTRTGSTSTPASRSHRSTSRASSSCPAYRGCERLRCYPALL